MNCPKCGEHSNSEVNFCRKCGASLKSHDGDTTSILTRPINKQNAPFFPPTGAPVTPLSKDIEGSKTVLKKLDNPAVNVLNNTSLPESLSFTVKEASLQNVWRKAAQQRGLLSLKDGFRDKLIRLRFVENDSFIYTSQNLSPEDQHNYLSVGKPPVATISFQDIESVLLKRGVFNSRMIIKLKPEKHGSPLLKIDPVSREIVLYIRQKECKVAKQIQSAIMREVFR
jgi:hypothetical protein